MIVRLRNAVLHRREGLSHPLGVRISNPAEKMDPGSSLPPIFVDGKRVGGLDGLGETLATVIATAAANANANLNFSSDTLG